MGVQIGGKEYSLAGNCSPGVMLILKERLQSGEGRGEKEGITKSEAPTRTGKFPDFRLGDFVKNWQDIGNGNLALGNPKNIQINNGTITK